MKIVWRQFSNWSQSANGDVIEQIASFHLMHIIHVYQSVYKFLFRNLICFVILSNFTGCTLKGIITFFFFKNIYNKRMCVPNKDTFFYCLPVSWKTIMWHHNKRNRIYEWNQNIIHQIYIYIISMRIYNIMKIENSIESEGCYI